MEGTLNLVNRLYNVLSVLGVLHVYFICIQIEILAKISPSTRLEGAGPEKKLEGGGVHE